MYINYVNSKSERLLMGKGHFKLYDEDKKSISFADFTGSSFKLNCGLTNLTFTKTKEADLYVLEKVDIPGLGISNQAVLSEEQKAEHDFDGLLLLKLRTGSVTDFTLTQGLKAIDEPFVHSEPLNLIQLNDYIREIIGAAHDFTASQTLR